MDIDELRALARHLADSLDSYRPPTPPPPPPPRDRTVLRPATVRVPGGDDLTALKALFPTAALRHGQDQGMWVAPGATVGSAGDGTFTVTLARADWSRPTNAALPLDRPVTAARISYGIQFPPQWQWGRSGKLPGLARHRAGWFPGGGRIGALNFSDCPAWARRGNQVGIGPYIYGQHQPAVPDQAWGPNYPDGTLRWGAPIVPGLENPGDRIWRFELDHHPTDDGRASVTTWRVDGATRWSHTVQILTPDQPHEITHCHFRVMFGGNTLDFWPPAPFAGATIRFHDFQVTEI